MRTDLLVSTSLLALVTLTGTALADDAGLVMDGSASPSSGAVGVGAEFQLSGLGGLSANYDTGTFHVGGFLGIFDPAGADNTDLAFGGRFYYHLHSSAMADFGIGGQVGIASDDEPGADERNTLLFLEPGLQIRAFIASNVALSFTAGLTLGFADADGAALEGQPTGSAGVHYYFF